MERQILYLQCNSSPKTISCSSTTTNIIANIASLVEWNFISYIKNFLSETSGRWKE